MIDETSDRPAYQQVADALRQRILSDEVRPGAKLPSESELIEEFEISRSTARLAYNVLRAEGLVVTRRGHGAYVRDRRQVRRIAADRYRRAASAAAQGQRETAFTLDRKIAWPDYRLDKDFREVGAPSTVADLLEVPPGTPVLERRFVFYSAGFPEQMSLSYYLLSLVSGTPVADPDNEPWPGGNIAQLASLGVAVTRVEESVGARMPSPDEVRTLRIPPGVPVLTVTRRMLTGPGRDRPVEAAVNITIPADRAVLDYAIDIE